MRVRACEWLRAARVSPLEAGVRDMGGAQHLFSFFCAYMFIGMAGFAVSGRARACVVIRRTLTQRETGDSVIVCVRVRACVFWLLNTNVIMHRDRQPLPV